MGDVVGRLFREFAVTLAVTILISAVVSLTLVPMLSARWLRPARGRRARSRLAQRSRPGSTQVSRRYAAALDWVLARQRQTLLVFVGTVALTGLLFVIIPKGLFPEQDTGQLQAVVVSRPGRLVPAHGGRLQQQVADALLDGSRRREPQLQCRRRRPESDAEQRPHADQPEGRRATRRARRDRSRDCEQRARRRRRRRRSICGRCRI